ncbi:AI-2E family transporter [Massilia sp. H6]|uniref:AI-2E family transporter n=1 Tax=Massilia sp. H6 TaxID=2970464 RepID=UPI002167E434|nr:AI-2E family transporter [Massilia sp. H6]UVW29310.1 AI-2E family transporter [Massilia sp. H6]
MSKLLPHSLSASPPDPVRMMLLTIGTITILYFGRDVLQPVALAILLSLILSPLSRALEARGMPRVVACILTVSATLALFGVAITVVLGQLGKLAAEFGTYKLALVQKLGADGGEDGVLTRLMLLLQQAADTLAALLSNSQPMDVRIVPDPIARLTDTIAPYLAFFGIALIVLILLTFLMIRREDMSDRIVGLFGDTRIGVTTRALDEAGGRISRYLSAFTAVNVFYGVVIGSGLWAIGVPLAVLWGALAGVLRFIPYVGAAAGMVGPVLLSTVLAPGWLDPILVLALFFSVELLLIAVVEPLLYGKSTGVSPIGLLVAASFWTWLWGPVGLLLSTPLTVSLAVAGKYMPGLGALALLLDEKSSMAPHLQFYHRLLAQDTAEARQMLASALEHTPMTAVFDALLLPLLAKCRSDADKGAISPAECSAIRRQIDDFLDELEWKAEVSMAEYVPGRASTPAQQRLIGIAWEDDGDLLALRMVNLLLAPWDQGLIAIGPMFRGKQALSVTAFFAPAVVLVTRSGSSEGEQFGRVAAALPNCTIVLLDSASNPGTYPGTSGGGTGSGRELVRVQTLAKARDAILGVLQSHAEVGKRLQQAIVAGAHEQAQYLYERADAKLSMDRLVTEVLEPMLRAQLQAAGGAGAAPGSPVVDFLLNKLRPVANAVRTFDADAKRAIIASPDGASEDLWMMMLAVSLRARDWDVLYLGNTIALPDLADVVDSASPDVVILDIDHMQLARRGELGEISMPGISRYIKARIGFGSGSIDEPAMSAASAQFSVLPPSVAESVAVLEQANCASTR